MVLGLVFSTAAWMLIVLGVAHVVYGLVRYKRPLREAVGEGFVGRFAQDDSRRLAFWFIVVGPLLTLLGQVSLRAAENGDVGVLRTVAAYRSIVALIAVLAFPKSPLWALWVPAALLIAGIVRG